MRRTLILLLLAVALVGACVLVRPAHPVPATEPATLTLQVTSPGPGRL